MHPKTIGLIAHTGKPGVGELIKSLTAEFARFSISVLLEKETAAVSGQRSDITIAQLGGKADLLVVVGGDGTILNVTGELSEASPPIFSARRVRPEVIDLVGFCITAAHARGRRG